MTDAVSSRRFFGALLMVVGALLAGLTGLCTGMFTIMSLAGQTHSHELDIPPLLPIMLGILPFMAGLALYFWGRWLFRSTPPPPWKGGPST